MYFGVSKRLVYGMATAGLLVAFGAQGGDAVRVEDTSTEGSDSFLDVTAIELSSDGSQLLIHVEASEDIGEYLQSNLPTRLISVLADSDMDGSSGGEDGSFSGVEQKISVYACVNYEMDAQACAGGFSGAAIANAFASYSLDRWDAGQSSFETVRASLDEGGQGEIAGTKAIVAIPYDQLGVASGQAIKVYVDAYSFDDDFPEDPVELQLK